MSTKFITKILSFVTSKFYCTDFPVPLYCRKWYYMLNANGLGLLVPHKHEIIQIFTAQVGLRAAAPIAGSKSKFLKSSHGGLHNSCCLITSLHGQYFFC